VTATGRSTVKRPQEGLTPSKKKENNAIYQQFETYQQKSGKSMIDRVVGIERGPGSVLDFMNGLCEKIPGGLF